MESILMDLGMEELVKAFTENEVGPSEFLNLTDDDYLRLGITSIGKKAKIRSRCKLYLEAASEDSPTIRRLRELQAARRRRIVPSKQSGSAPTKPTRRLSVGWRHKTGESRCHTQMSHAKGGGTHRIDCAKTATLDELTTDIISVFFPGGESRIQQLKISELEYQLATFTGATLPVTLGDGEPFSLEGYYKQLSVNPMRVYLYTAAKSQQEDNADMRVGDIEADLLPNLMEQDTLPDLDQDVLSVLPINADTTNHRTTTRTIVRPRLSLRRPHRRNQGLTTPSVNDTSSTVDPQSSGTDQPSDRRNQALATPSVNDTSSTVDPQSSGTDQPSDRRNQPLTTPSVNDTSSTMNPQSSGTDQPSAISPQPSSGSSPVNQTPADISLPSVSSDRIREPPPPSSNRPSTADGRFDGMSDDDKDDDFMTAGSPGVFFRVTNDVDQTLTDFSSKARDNAELLEAFQTLKECLQGESQIFVNRRNLLDDVFRIYDNSEITTQDIKVSFLGESGSDFGGLSKDFLTTAWRELLPKYFDGEDAVVPSLPLYRYRAEKDKYVAIGRFVSHSAAILEVLPPRLSRTSLLAIIFEDDVVSDDTLLDDFLLFLAPLDRSLVKRALRHFDILSLKQKSDLQDFFSIHQMQDVPKESKIRQQILSIAQLVLVDRPAPLLKKMRQGIPSLHMEKFWALLTTEGVNFIFARQRPTGDKVANVITSSEEVLRPEEERCLYYLKQLVSGLDQEDLSSLLQFVTGSTLMPDSITISFRHVTGEMRCPIAHTCTNMLELPSTYVSLQDMKREFRSVLACHHSFEMSIL